MATTNKQIQFIALLCIAWAIAAPLYLCQRSARHELGRKWGSMQVLGETVSHAGTNDTNDIRTYGEMLRSFAEEQQEENSASNTVIFISSALIVILSLT